MLLFDASQPLPAEQRSLLEEFPVALTVLTKCDLPAAERPNVHGPVKDTVLSTSAVTGAGIADLLTAISSRLVPEAPCTGAAVPFTAAQTLAIDGALARRLHIPTPH